MSPARFHRSTREAFAAERFPALFGPFRRRRQLRGMLTTGAALALWAGIGVLLAWRG